MRDFYSFKCTGLSSVSNANLYASIYNITHKHIKSCHKHNINHESYEGD